VIATSSVVYLKWIASEYNKKYAFALKHLLLGIEIPCGFAGGSLEYLKELRGCAVYEHCPCDYE
jgi:hypothetical protein